MFALLGKGLSIPSSSTAGALYYAGNFKGYIDVDVKSNFLACFPEDIILAKDIDEEMKQIARGDSLEQLKPLADITGGRFLSDLSSC